MASVPKVGIVLINLNAYDDTARCLQSLREITYSESVVVVVDNGSIDGSGVKLQKEFPDFHFLLSSENLGFTGGNNLGIQAALEQQCDHVLLLNNDTIVTPSFLEPLVERMSSDSSIAAVSGKIYYWPAVRAGSKNTIWFAGSRRRWHTCFGHIGDNEVDHGQYDTARSIPYASGCLMLMRGSVIREIGMLSDDYFIYWEEADWCARAIESGYSSYYEPRSIIYHNFRSSEFGKETPFFNYLHARNALLYAKRHNRGKVLLQFIAFYPLVILYRAYYDIRSGNYKGARAIFSGTLDYFKGYRGKQQLLDRGLIKS